MPRSSRNILEKLKEFDSPTISNAVEVLGIRSKLEGYTNSEIKCLFPNFGVMVGYALTASIDTMNEKGENRKERQIWMYEAIQSERAKGPVVIVVKDASRKSMAAALWGGIMSTVCHSLGCVGLVTDGAVRDLADAENLSFHYFAAGVVVSHGASTWVKSLREPVEVCGLKVETGDIIHADRNGVVVIPSSRAGDVVTEATKVRDVEGKYVRTARSPEFSLAKFKEVYLKS